MSIWTPYAGNKKYKSNTNYSYFLNSRDHGLELSSYKIDVSVSNDEPLYSAFDQTQTLFSDPKKEEILQVKKFFKCWYFSVAVSYMVYRLDSKALDTL